MDDILTNKSYHAVAEKSFFIALHEKDLLHLKRFCGRADGPVVFMLHGTVENGRIFYSKNGKGLAPFLAKHGFDVFVADLRGRGESTPQINRHSKYGLSESISEEIPAFIKEIKKIRGNVPLHFVSHSWGGILLLCYLSRYAQQLKISSMVFFGTKRRITIGGIKKFWTVNVVYNLVFRIIIAIRGFADLKRFFAGKENETEKSRRQTYQWVTQDEWNDEDGFDYAKALRNMELPPSLFIAGGSDEVLGHHIDVQKLILEIAQPQAEFYLAGKANGNKHNYNHINMLTHPDAPQDHFQYVLEWMRKNERR